MKESLSILKTSSSGLEDRQSIAKKIRTDSEILKKANQFQNIQDKENYLLSELESLPTGLVRSKILLSEIIKDKNLKLACELLISASYYSPLEPSIYIQYAKIALKNNAFKVAKSVLEAARWVCDSKESDVLIEISILEEFLLKNKSEKDTGEQFWKNKFLSKMSILDRLLLQSTPKNVAKYCFKLLDVFPKDPENFYFVFLTISTLKKKSLYFKFIEYVEKCFSSNDKNKSMYLGLACFGLFDFENSISYLNEVLKSDPMNSRCLLYLSLNYLLMGDEKSFINASSMILPTSEPVFMSAYFINSAFSGFEMDKKEFPNQKEVSKSISLVLSLLLENHKLLVVDHVLGEFKKLNYYSILPGLPFYLCEVFIEKNLLDYAKNILDDNSNPEAHRFKSWIYRIEGKNDLAESELLLFRKSLDPLKKSFECKLVGVDFPDPMPNSEDEILSALSKSYDDVKSLISRIDLEYGIDTYTCMEAACQDCCKKTFPFVSYVEYLYMKKWFDNQSDEYKANIVSKSVDILNRLEKQYGKKPFFVVGDKEVRDEFPNEFFFECPYLGDNKCNVHESRPFTCRAYGYGSQDGVKFKGCNYLYDQYKFASNLDDGRKVLNMNSFYEFTTEVDKKLIGEKVLAPIPVWFAQSHEKTLEIIKNLISTK